jgi:hypothetical protein
LQRWIGVTSPLLERDVLHYDVAASLRPSAITRQRTPSEPSLYNGALDLVQRAAGNRSKLLF